jgi:undecaprenyl-diphosphatase
LRALLEKRRPALLLAAVLAVAAIKVSEDALGGESGPLDETVLVFIHGHVPRTLTWLFEAITATGSLSALLPLTLAVIFWLLYAAHRLEALFFAVSVSAGAATTYVVKAAAGRTRPDLWDTAWYWGSSFPSGHTLATAAFATAAVVCVDRIRPAASRFAIAIALTWILLVGFSRLVAGVHWPTDVLAAACIGAFLPVAMSMAFTWHHGKS